MNKVFMISFILTSYLIGKSQSSLYGIYKMKNGDSVFSNRQMLILNCDQTFLLIDSGIKFTSTGTWKQNEHNGLLLSADKMIFKSDTSYKTRELTYLIKDDQLHDTKKIVSKRKYDRQIKKDGIRMYRQIGEIPMYEPYEKFRARQENLYFIKVESIGCK